jgi:hypothetical protein
VSTPPSPPPPPTPVPGDAANVTLPKKRKAKKQATTTASPTRCNPKHKNYLDDAIIDTISPNPLEV